MSNSKIDLRLRVALAFAVMCIAVVGAFGVTLYMTAEEMEEALVEQIVAEELDYLIERYRANPDLRPAAGPSFAYYVVHNAEEASRLPPEVRSLPPGNHEIRIGSDERHVAVRQVGDTRFIVAYDVGPHEAREQQFKNILVLSLILIAAFSLVLGYWLAGVLTRQLTALAGRVAALTPGEPHAPLADPQQDSEVAALARALDDYQSRIRGMIEREQEFTANASHELRTPLTAITTSCELLLADPVLPDKARARVQMIERAAQRMAQQLQALLFIAREESLDASEEVALAECVSEAAEPYRGEIARRKIAFEIAVAADTVLRLNRNALQTVLGNLLRNAVEHTERGFIRVDFQAPRLTVADSGAGIAPDHLPRLFERYYRASDRNGGFGLGLSIVKRICDHYGWRVEVASEPGRGSCFAIVLR